MTKIRSAATVAQMNADVIDSIIELANQAINQRNAFHLALAGGSTPKTIYELMATATYRDAIAWDKVHIYFGDERCVPADHPDSNYRMARLALLSKVPITDDHVHPMTIDLDDIAGSAARYEQELQDHLPAENGVPVFDLILLGIGDDGHTASLFPGTAILREQRKLVDAVYVEKFQAWRISLTYPVLNAAANVFIIAAGSGKADIIRQVLLQENIATPYPVQKVNPAGDLVWCLDAAAAAKLPVEMLDSGN